MTTVQILTILNKLNFVRVLFSHPFEIFFSISDRIINYIYFYETSTTEIFHSSDWCLFIQKTLMLHRLNNWIKDFLRFNKQRYIQAAMTHLSYKKLN